LKTASPTKPREVVKKDLVVLVEGKDDEKALDELLKRHHSLGVRALQYDIFVHPNSGPGCRVDSPNFLRSYTEQYRFALVVFDQEGCGAGLSPAHQLEAALRSQLNDGDWNGRAEVVVITPELEAWVWGQSPHIEIVLGWADRTPTLRDWLVEKGWCLAGAAKPERPKEAMAAALRHVRKPWSSSLHSQLAAKASWKSCEDDSFLRFQSVLRNWFSL
jgi:hypothetical protein